MESRHSILVIEDDPELARFLRVLLETEGYNVEVTHNWKATRNYFRTRDPDLVLLDLVLPDMHGTEIAKRIREISATGIIVVTGSVDQGDKIVSLDAGADDYVEKPFERRELLARIRSVLRRLKKDSTPTVMTFNQWQLDTRALELRDPSGSVVELTQGEYNLLYLFVDRANRVLSRDDIADHLSFRDWVPTDRSIDMMVSKLRKKLAAQSQLIKTVRGKGYLFAATVEQQQS